MPNYTFTKDASRYRPRAVLQNTFNLDSYGTKYTVDPIDRPFYREAYLYSGGFGLDIYKTRIHALKNTINYYFSTDPDFNFNAIINKPISILSLSSYHLGSGIKKGSIKLTVNYSGVIDGGTKSHYATDIKQDGILYDDEGLKIGFVLYKEGFIFITSSKSLFNKTGMTVTDADSVIYTTNNYRWYHYGAKTSVDAELTNQHTFATTNEISTYLSFIYADKGELNHSNNPTYLKNGSYKSQFNDRLFIENQPVTNDEIHRLEIKNTVSSSFNYTNAQFDKQTFISSIGLYDKDKKLIGVSNLAIPLRKTTNREFLFKLKLDI